MTSPPAIAELPVELQAVAETAALVVRTLAADDSEPLSESRDAARGAVIAAVEAGHPLSAIAAAEKTGQDTAREQLRGELLKRIGRSARRVQAVTNEHHDDIRRADRAGLSAREIATAAHVTHATIRSIVSRQPDANHEADDATDPEPPPEPHTDHDHGEWHG
jgi:hypothetical protein